MRRIIGVCALSLLPVVGNSGTPDAIRQAKLRYLLQQDCGSCHGLTLKGGLGPSLLPQALAGKPREVLASTIRDGRPGTAMPPWRSELDEDDIAWLVDFLLAGAGPD